MNYDEEHQKKVVHFITGSAKAPPNGLGTVKLVIGRMCPDSEQLPTAHTCFNHLLLPHYATKEKLANKLLIALENNQGFGLM